MADNARLWIRSMEMQIGERRIRVVKRAVRPEIRVTGHMLLPIGFLLATKRMQPHIA